MKDHIEYNGVKYEWLGQSTVRITGAGRTVYTDPVALDQNPPKADLILISHHHVDHCLPEFIIPIRDENTRLAAFHESYLKYCVQDIKGVRTVKIGQTVDMGGITLTGIEAYTSRGFHRKGEGCGFLIEFGGQKVYFAGDTAKIKEMEDLRDIDVAIMPIADNTYAIEMDEIAEAVKVIKPGLFIPVHFTPMDEPEPEIKGELFFSKDPKFYTRKADPGELLSLFDGTGIEVAVLKKIGRRTG